MVVLVTNNSVFSSCFNCLIHACIIHTLCPFKFCNHLEERAGCFTLIVFFMSCDFVFCGSSSRCLGLVIILTFWGEIQLIFELEKSLRICEMSLRMFRQVCTHTHAAQPHPHTVGTSSKTSNLIVTFFLLHKFLLHK